MTNKRKGISPIISVMLLLLVAGFMVYVFTFAEPQDKVQADCPEKAPIVSQEEAVDLVRNSNGFFQEGCLVYHINRTPQYAVVEGGR